MSMYQLVSQLHIPDTLLVLEATLSAPDVSELSVLRQLASRFLGDKRYEGFKDAVIDLRQELDALLVHIFRFGSSALCSKPLMYS